MRARDHNTDRRRVTALNLLLHLVHGLGEALLAKQIPLLNSRFR